MTISDEAELPPCDGLSLYRVLIQVPILGKLNMSASDCNCSLKGILHLFTTETTPRSIRDSSPGPGSTGK